VPATSWSRRREHVTDGRQRLRRTWRSLRGRWRSRAKSGDTVERGVDRTAGSYGSNPLILHCFAGRIRGPLGSNLWFGLAIRWIDPHHAYEQVVLARTTICLLLSLLDFCDLALQSTRYFHLVSEPLARCIGSCSAW
jgi:hypothetical protein